MGGQDDSAGPSLEGSGAGGADGSPERTTGGGPETVLGRVLPGTVRGRMRTQFRFRTVAGFLGGVVVAALAGALIRLADFPGSRPVGWLAVVGISAAGAGWSLRRTRRLQAAKPLPRSPEHGNVGGARSPDLRGLIRRRRQLLVTVGLAVLMGTGVLVVTPWLATTDAPGSLPLGLPQQAAWLLGPFAAVLLLGDARASWRALRRVAAVDVTALEPVQVTVIGFAGLGEVDVVFVPGAVSPDAALQVLARGRGPVFAATVGGALGELVAGDVLVCHGRLERHAVVHLANATRGTWIPDLRIPDRSEIFRDQLPGTADGGDDGASGKPGQDRASTVTERREQRGREQRRDMSGGAT